MSSRLPCDPHPRTTKKASASAAAVQLLLRHRGGRAGTKDESIEFFSALSDQTDERAADRTGKTKPRAEIGKHDYDWLLTPPATPLSCSPALSRLTRATSASHAKSNSPLSRARRDKGSSSSLNTTELASSGRPHVRRTLSSASSSSVKATSSASGKSTPATSPRTPAAATACRPRPQDKTHGRHQVSSGSGAASQSKGSSSSSTGPSALTSARPRAPTTGASSPKSTTRVASEQPALTRRGGIVAARSRFAGQLSRDAMSTAQAAENAVPPSMVKTRPVPAAVKQRSHGNGTSPSPATATSRSAPRGDLLASKRLSASGVDGRKVHDDKAAARRTVGFGSSVASTRRCLTKSDSRKLTVNEGAQQRSVRPAASGSRLGSAATVSDARGRRQSTAGKDKVAVASPDAFPSTRYDAMLLREDPKNLTWLNGCGEDDDDGEDGSCGAGLVDGSLEPFHVE
ncbi:hypothetical protein CFC21_022136 [Triticum aestivum]|uniref:Uncharacterized protein n=3 Tax=Triticum TaxID=4564 RepID=A0A9R1PHZ4_TRITD|nr:mucin-21-like [Triticum aestivum]KAF7007176.1 hypothetical protein CFC21_022136 [Triticum aestivum]VAH43070.1 unnamed protein product [Triticum turgidum subsp. durum]